jgi:multicomponent Na+:H+ antiporter subunit C
MGNLIANYEEAVAITLFGIGFSTLLFHRNLIKKIIGLNIMDTGVYLFLASMGYIYNKAAPILTDLTAEANVEDYINPIPSALVLTGIVVSVSVTAISLALSVRLYKKYHTLNLDEIYMKAVNQEKEVF